MSPSADRICVPDLKKERINCYFDQEELTNIIDGGKEKTEFRRKFQKLFLSDPEFLDPIPPDYLSHEDRYANDLRKACYMVQKLTEDPETQEFASDMSAFRMLMGSELGMALMKDGNPLALHYIMFIPTLMGQASPDQQAEWMGRAWRCEIIGTYAQTELGHGTNLRGLETTATYNVDNQEFVLHSPTITSAKWWPGSLGKTANYAVVMAQLYTGGQCKGPHPFIVQLRDENTHASLPGIAVGEIGPKMGMNTNDNGYLLFDQVRIPRTQMLMRYSQVLEDGTYMRPSSDKLAYGTMMFVRVAICYDVCRQLQRAVTIATRYSAVRRQSELIVGQPEPQVLDYQTQQYKIIPQIATAFAIFFSACEIRESYNELTGDLSSGNLELLPEMHALTCGLKALSTDDCTRGVDICRLACGGHGYLGSSNLPRIYTFATAAITYEGENTVLWLQVARFLIKSLRDATKGVQLPDSVSYLNGKFLGNRRKDLSNQALVDAFRRSAFHLISETESQLVKKCSVGGVFELAWNDCSVSLVKCAQVHTRSVICAKFVHSVENLNASEGVRTVLNELCRLYLLYYVGLCQGELLRSGALSASDLTLLEAEMALLLASLRSVAVALVDSFDIHDRILDSTLGCWDGNVYERLFKEAMASPLNKTDVPKAYSKYLQPMLLKARL